MYIDPTLQTLESNLFSVKLVPFDQFGFFSAIFGSGLCVFHSNGIVFRIEFVKRTPIHMMCLRMMQPISLVVLLLFFPKGCTSLSQDLQCSINPENEEQLDPALREMEYDVGYGPQKTLVWVEPPVESFYPSGEAPSKTKVVPKFNGFAGKFINMSHMPVSLYWYVTVCILKQKK